MNKLKTLREIKQEDIDPKDGYEYNEGEIKISRLKKEAITWIKELNKQSNGCFCLTCCKGSDKYNNLSCSNIHWKNTLITSDPWEPHGTEESVKWIKYFFGITEEELK
jgi:hypothetical protein